MSKPVLLIVTADVALGARLMAHLTADFLVDEVRDGLACLRRLAEQPPDLIVMDTQIPKLDGWNTLKRVVTTAPVPVIMLVPAPGERLRALQLGAADAVSQPIDSREVAARTHAVLRRFRSKPPQTGAVGQSGLVFDPAAQTVTFQGRVVDLSQLQYDILAVLAARPGQVVSRAALRERIWGPDSDVDLRSIDTHIKHLRRKLGDRNAVFISNAWGIGYRFTS